MRISRFAATALLLVTAGCFPLSKLGLTPPPTDALVLKRTEFAALDQWAASDPRLAFKALTGSCKTILARPQGNAFGGASDYGTFGDWKAPCEAAVKASPASADEARAFFEKWFTPAIASNKGEQIGLFTGYYEPQLSGSRRKHGKFQTPLYTRPNDLVSVDLGAFRPAMKGEKIAGRIQGSSLVPYDTRGAIVAGALGARTKPLVYVDDPVDAFFLQVQGSGRVKLENGKIFRVGYDGQNGHPYTAIGRVLVDRGEIKREDLSMQSIRTWLAANPSKATALMNENASYVFFKELVVANPEEGAPGSQGVPLTPEASLAVDTKFHGLGAPMWIEANAPAEDASKPDETFRRLVVAQDTGGAIRGPVRGDVYWGAGAKAETVAGRMAHRGKLYVLLPQALAAKLQPAS